MRKGRKNRQAQLSQPVISPASRKWIWGLVASLAIAGAAGWVVYSQQRSARTPAAETASKPTFEPTAPNSSPSPAGAPEGMVWIPGGEFSMGTEDPHDMSAGAMNSMADARPIHRVYVDGFWMDKTDVTNKQFEQFVKATGYVTVAEEKPGGGLSRRAAAEPGGGSGCLRAAGPSRLTRQPLPMVELRAGERTGVTPRERIAI